MNGANMNYKTINLVRLVSFALSAFAVTACASSERVEATYVTANQIDQILEWKAEHKASTIGIGVIEAGELAWTGYYGEQSPGIPASETTMFNTASVSKAITAELAIRLVDKGLIDLDEPVFKYYIHPDIADDPRHKDLTPRILLNHTSGFLNWPTEYDDGKLAFVRDPGSAFGYSGAGFDIFANFLEAKLSQTFPELVQEHIFDPFGMEKASQVQADWMIPYRIQPLDETGAFIEEFNLEMGYWNPADDYYATVEDHALPS